MCLDTTVQESHKTLTRTAISFSPQLELCMRRKLHAQVTLSGSDFDTLLAVYTGYPVTDLTLVANNDNCTTGGSPSGASCITFNVSEHTLYSLQVDGVGGGKGSFRIELTAVWAAPVNDAFSAALATFPAIGTTLGATLEAGEPQAVTGVGASGSVWFRITSAGSGVAQVTASLALQVAQEPPYPLPY